MAYDYEGEALSRLTSQFQDAPNVRALVRELVRGLNAVDADIEALAAARSIDNAYGALLDYIGAVLGVPRSGRTDEVYRSALRFRQIVLRADGTPTSLLRGLKFLTQPTDAQLIEQYPASVLLFTNGETVPTTIAQDLGQLLPVAVENLNVAVSYGDKPFRLGTSGMSADMYVNDDVLLVNDFELGISTPTLYEDLRDTGLGGVVPGELALSTGAYLDIGGGYLSVYNPNTAIVTGDTVLAGVFHER